MKLELKDFTIEFNKVFFEDAWELKRSFMNNINPSDIEKIKKLDVKRYSEEIMNLSLKFDNDSNIMKTVRNIIIKYSKKINGNLIADIDRERVIESYMSEPEFQKNFGNIVVFLFSEVASHFFENHRSILPIAQGVVGKRVE